MPAALFDLDGVIVDSESSYTEFWDSVERAYPTGIPDYALAIKGTNLDRILSNYDSSRVREDIVARLHEFENSMDFPLYPGAMEFLEDLAARGIPKALVTSSDNAKMKCLYRRLPLLECCFDVVVTGSMVSRSKPHPEGYLKAAALLGCDPRECWVFEDSLQGLRAGIDSGAAVIAMTTTNPRDKVAPLCHCVLDSWDNFTVDDMLAVSREKLGICVDAI